MITLDNVSKTFWVRGRPKVVADGISATFPTGAAVALLGRNGAGKSSMLSMLAGSLAPDPVGLGAFEQFLASLAGVCLVVVDRVHVEPRCFVAVRWEAAGCGS